MSKETWREVDSSQYLLDDSDIEALESFQCGLANDMRWQRGFNLFKVIEKMIKENKPLRLVNSLTMDKRTRICYDLPKAENEHLFIQLGEHHRVDHVRWSAIYSAYYSVQGKRIVFARSWAAVWKH